MAFGAQSSEFFFKVVLIGAPSVGKTSILERFVEDKFSQDYKATIGADFRTKEIDVDGQNVLLQIWDTAGQERFRALAAPFYRGANICVLVFDVSQPLTFEAIEQWRDEFLHHADVDDQQRFPFILLGNKTDLGAKVSKQEVQNWMSERGFNMEYLDTSAKDDLNITESFQRVGKLCLQDLPSAALYKMENAQGDLDDFEQEEEEEAPVVANNRDDNISLEDKMSEVTDIASKKDAGGCMC